MTFILRELVTNPAYSHLVDMFHWIIIPVVNPDGYVYTHTKVLQTTEERKQPIMTIL